MLKKIPIHEYTKIFGEPSVDTGGEVNSYYWCGIEKFNLRAYVDRHGNGFIHWSKRHSAFSVAGLSTEEVLNKCSPELADKIIFNLDLFL